MHFPKLLPKADVYAHTKKKEKKSDQIIYFTKGLNLVYNVLKLNEEIAEDLVWTQMYHRNLQIEFFSP